MWACDVGANILNSWRIPVVVANEPGTAQTFVVQLESSDLREDAQATAM